MRVLTISSVFPDAVRPAFGIFVKERARYVAEHCEVVVCAPIPWFPMNRRIRGLGLFRPRLTEEHDGLKVYRPRFLSIPRYGKSLDGMLYFLGILPFVTWLRGRFPFDVIDAHFAYPDGFAAAMLGKLFRRPTFITIRGDELRLLQYRARRAQMRFALRAARVISVSDSLREVVTRLGLDANDVRVIPNGVDASVFRPLDRHEARRRLKLPSDRTILLSVGALIERKGHHRVIEILQDVIRWVPDLLYVVVGNDPPGNSYRKIIEELVQGKDLRDHVTLVPPCPHEEVPLWMAAADLFCLATRAEGWCNALTEALACGLSVVTTQVGGSAEFIADGRDGFLVPYWNAERFAGAVVEALGSEWSRDGIAERAHRRGWTQTARAVMQEFGIAHQTRITTQEPLGVSPG